MFADTAALARECAQQGRGLAAFNVVLLDHAEAFIDAAERCGLPLVLQLSQNAVKYHGGRLAPLGKALLELARASSARVAVHLDHAEDPGLCRAAIDLGFSSIMYDGSALPDADNRASTKRIAEAAHAAGISVEAELGEVGGKNGVHAPGARTDPGDAARFVAATGVDLLAVAVGSSHAMTERSALLDDELISRLAAAVPVPLVLHGSSGVSDEGLRSAVRAGITKVNVSTHLNVVAAGVVRDVLAADPELVDPRRYIGPSVRSAAAEAERLLTWYASAARRP